MARPKRWDLARLIHPIDPDLFFREHFESRVLHVPRTDREYFASLLSLEEIDRVLTTLNLSHPSVHMANAAKELKVSDYTYPSGLIDVARLYQEYADGGSIVLNNLEMSVPAMAHLCRSMEAQFSSRFQCNIYVTPQSNQGLKTHYDTHDVFVLQIDGVKHWTIYDTPVVRPFRGQDFRPERDKAGERTMEFDLRPGDMVYVPRGVMHDAASTAGDSCHITLGILPTSWTDLLLEAVARVGLEDPELRRTLPAGYARHDYDRREARAIFRDLMHRVLDKANFDAALDHFAEDLVSTRHPILHGQMQQVRSLQTLTVEDLAGPRDHILFHLIRDAERITVAAYGGQIKFPLHAAEALEYALKTPEYRVSDLPGDLDDAGKLVLIRKLVREGLVEILR